MVNNTLELPYEELCLREFMEAMFTFTYCLPDSTSFDQVRLPDSYRTWDVVYYRFPLHTLAVAKAYLGKDGPQGDYVRVGADNRYALRFFRIGCKHTFEEISREAAKLRHPHMVFVVGDRPQECSGCGMMWVTNSR